jgi:enoyl-CoA hydratase/carnithine racemase
MMMKGVSIKGKEGYELGLIDKIVEKEEELIKEAYEIGIEILKGKREMRFSLKINDKIGKKNLF